MLIDQNLKENSEALKVNGLNGLVINQKLSFGEFQTNAIEKGWRTTKASKFIFDKVEAKQKVNFQIKDKSGIPVEVNCAAKYTENSFNLFRKLISVDLSKENIFAGSINSSEMSWDFNVSKRVMLNTQDKLAGELTDLNNKIEVYEAHRFNNKYKTPSSDVLGYEFKQAGITIAAVQLINGGYVWMRTGLPQKTRLSLAALAAALMVRPNLVD